MANKKKKQNKELLYKKKVEELNETLSSEVQYSQSLYRENSDLKKLIKDWESSVLTDYMQSYKDMREFKRTELKQKDDERKEKHLVVLETIKIVVPTITKVITDAVLAKAEQKEQK